MSFIIDSVASLMLHLSIVTSLYSTGISRQLFGPMECSALLQSQNLVLNKSVDLTSKCFCNNRKFKRPADDIKELKLEWNKKMNDLEKEGLSI